MTEQLLGQSPKRSPKDPVSLSPEIIHWSCLGINFIHVNEKKFRTKTNPRHELGMVEEIVGRGRMKRKIVPPMA